MGVTEQLTAIIDKEVKRATNEQVKVVEQKHREHISQLKREHKEQSAPMVQSHREQISQMTRLHRDQLSSMEKKHQETLYSIIEKVSRLYSVPIRVARRDLMGDDTTHCMGIKKNGKLCMNRAIQDGYCMFHVNDPRPCTPILMPQGLRHNHAFPSGFVTGCPACENQKVNEFRELDSIM
jgi:hypothetical protein